MSEDQFTSVQWDREEADPVEPTTAIPEETEEQVFDESTDSPPEYRTNEDLPTEEANEPDKEPESEPQDILEADTEEPKPEYALETAVTSPFRDVDTHSKPFISYMLTTTTNHPAILKLCTNSSAGTPKKAKNGDSNLKGDKDYITIKTRRRYGDFRILHDSLSNDFPTYLIPPLPLKLNFKYLTGDTFSQSFVQKRLHLLNRFIKFILEHSKLRQLTIFYVFVSDSSDWATFVKTLKGGYKDDDPGFVNKVVNEDLITETVMNFLTPAKHKKETNKEILEINDKLKKLYENLTKLDKIFSRMNKKNADLAQDYTQFSQQISKLLIVQTVDLSEDKPEEVDSGSEPMDGVLTNFKIFAELLDYFSKSWNLLHAYVDELFLVALKDCAKYIVSLTHLIEQQHNKSIDLQVLQDYLLKSKNDLVLMAGETGTGGHVAPPNPLMTGSNGGVVQNTAQLIKDTLSTSATPHIGSAINESKVQKLRSKISLLEAEIDSQTKIVNDLTNRIINEEYPNWDRFNRGELKDAMLGLCDEKIKFYNELLDKWGEVEAKLVKRLESL